MSSIPPPLILSLPGFEGTLDDLLSLVRSGLFSVTSLPLSPITGAVLRWVGALEGQAKLDSGDALEVSAALIRLKSRSLLPAPQSPPAAAAAAEQAGVLEDLEALRAALEHLREMWRPRRLLAQNQPETAQDEPENVLDLIRTLEQALHLTRSVPPPLLIDREPFQLKELCQLILDRCAAHNHGYHLNELLTAQPAAAPELFLAALELVRNEQVTVDQAAVFGAIHLHCPTRPD